MRVVDMDPQEKRHVLGLLLQPFKRPIDHALCSQLRRVTAKLRIIHLVIIGLKPLIQAGCLCQNRRSYKSSCLPASFLKHLLPRFDATDRG